jgi:WD40 repeat protein
MVSITSTSEKKAPCISDLPQNTLEHVASYLDTESMAPFAITSHSNKMASEHAIKKRAHTLADALKIPRSIGCAAQRQFCLNMDLWMLKSLLYPESSVSAEVHVGPILPTRRTVFPDGSFVVDFFLLGNATVRKPDGSVKMALGGRDNTDPRRGHTDQVTHVEALTDNTCITASCDHTALLWNEDGTVRMRLGEVKNIEPSRGHTSSVIYATVLPDHTYITTSADSTAIVWNPDGTVRMRLGEIDNRENPTLGHVGSVTYASVLPGGGFVTASQDHTAIVWNPDGTVRMRLGEARNRDHERGHMHFVKNVIVLPNLGFITTSDDYTAIVWNPEGTVRMRLGHIYKLPRHFQDGHTGPVTQVRIAPNGSIVTSAFCEADISWGIF